MGLFAVGFSDESDADVNFGSRVRADRRKFWDSEAGTRGISRLSLHYSRISHIDQSVIVRSMRRRVSMLGDDSTSSQLALYFPEDPSPRAQDDNQPCPPRPEVLQRPAKGEANPTPTTRQHRSLKNTNQINPARGCYNPARLVPVFKVNRYRGHPFPISPSKSPQKEVARIAEAFPGPG